MSELKLSEQFRLHFQQLRRACNDSPQSLINFFREKPKIEAHAKEVKRLADTIERVSTLRKLHAQIAPEFIRDWQNYLSNWKTQVEYVDLWPMLNSNLFDEEDFAPPSFECFRENRSGVSALESPEPLYDEKFEPTRHDGGIAVAEMVNLVAERAADRHVNAQDDNDIVMANTVLIGVEAIEHLENVIGIDIARIFERWNRMPAVFVPRHVSDHYGLTENRSLFGLFDQAVRAYVAGAPAAAIALCRSLLETVLKNHYLTAESGNERRKLDRAKLDKVIELAVARYDFLDKGQLDAHRKNANRILHDFSGGKALSTEDEIDLLKFFRDLKNYIEQAPSEPTHSE